MEKLLLLALGGSAGALSRYGLAGLVHKIFGGTFPLGTFVVNMCGCLFFGLVWGFLENRTILGPAARTAVLTGFMGAFTTFSTYIFESSSLLRDGQWWSAIANIAGQTVLGLVLLTAGLFLARLIP
ncbi:fluoride efflux transporter CrcB [Desulfobaculum bizertense]|uniref:Fluoride-specific ion channel FluC n=1 Tax=Desulfobaculum bizertense DSM 18034 TaxID=1121442 RepID=A0A1T4WW68_9BACT|nr:fluoride efflux transporter CrcB [Desulfobaculum bizertense]UIJ38585.1 fluoride efflux transporter CrcB [Desulfobaculum bizertense]SKA81566.1 CrcB protein [Desulfobaculum bizertense DSM 18034]